MSPLAVTTPMSLLESGVPLSLLLDLALGPCSEQILGEERQLFSQPGYLHLVRTPPQDA